MRSMMVVGLLASSAPILPPAFAQKAPSTQAPSPPPAPSDDEDEGDSRDIVVNGKAPPGSVIGDIPPENQLGPRAIASYGVGTVNELLAQIALMTGSALDDQGSGPVILVNGKRVSGVNEVGDLPTESILRVDILPEEVALKYGYSATQKVVNIILRRRFRSWVFNAGGGLATEGQGGNESGDATITRIRDNDRLNIAVRASNSASLLESERDITPNAAATSFDTIGNIVSPSGGEIDPALSLAAGQTVTVAGVPSGIASPTLSQFAATAGQANVTNDTAYRTLSPSKRDYSINAVFAHQISKKITSSLNFRAERSTAEALIGLPSGTLSLPAGSPFSPFTETVGVARYFGDKPLTQDNTSTTLHGGGTVNVDFNPKWRLSLIGAYDHSESVTNTERGYDLSAYQAALAADDPTVSPYGPASPLLGALQSSRASNHSNSGSASALLTGPLFKVPAGSVRTSLSVGGTASNNASVTTGAVTSPATDLSRTTGTVSASLDVPLTSKTFLKPLGNLTLNLNASRTEVSQFKTLAGYGYGLNWTPRTPLTLIASVNKSQRAPSLQQLDGPTITTGNVRVYDYTTGQTALVSRTSGGNPDLAADDRRTIKLGGTYKPFKKTELTITADYVASRDRNGIGAFPGVSAALQTAFPDRFLRDADGDLVAIDTRSVNFARQDETQLRWGFDFTHILRKTKGPPPRNGPPRWRPGEGPPTMPDGSHPPAPPPDADGNPPPPPPGDGGADAPSGGASPSGGAPDEITVNGQTPPPGSAFGNGGGGGGRRRGEGFGGGFGGGGFGRGDFRGGVGGGGRGGPGGGGRGPGGGGFGRGDNGASLEISAYHTWIFRDTVVIREGIPQVDLLNGGTLGGSAMPRQEIQLNAGINDNGVGLRLTGQWQNAAKVIGDATSTNGTLYFSSLGTISAHAFVNLQQRMRKEAWARGIRLNLSVTNILNDRQKVRNAAGVTPLAYQPGYLDPLGRTIAFSIRKIF